MRTNWAISWKQDTKVTMVTIKEAENCEGNSKLAELLEAKTTNDQRQHCNVYMECEQSVNLITAVPEMSVTISLYLMVIANQ